MGGAGYGRSGGGYEVARDRAMGDCEYAGCEIWVAAYPKERRLQLCKVALDNPVREPIVSMNAY